VLRATPILFVLATGASLIDCIPAKCFNDNEVNATMSSTCHWADNLDYERLSDVLSYNNPEIIGM